MADEAPGRSRTSPLWWGAVGGAVFGAWDVGRTALLTGLAPGPVAGLGLALLGVLPAAVVGALAAGLVHLVPRWRPDRLGALFAGLLGAAVTSLATAWFVRPGPYALTWPGQGNPVVLGAVTLVLLLVAVALWTRAGRRARPVALALLAVVGVLTLWLGRQPPPAPGSGPNVLLVTLDGARVDRFLDPRVDTTAVNRVGAEGARFARAFAQVPYTGPSYATLLTGTAPWEHGVWLDGVALPDDQATLAQVLGAAGWDTAAFLGSERLGRGLGLERGFRVYDDDLDWFVGARHLPAGRVWALVTRDGVWPQERRADRVVERALAWIDDRPGPWFAWVQLGDARSRLEPPPPYDTRYLSDGGTPGGDSPEALRARYDGALASADHQVARLLDRLDATGLAANTLVVVTAPSGRALPEDDDWAGRGDLADALVHVPLVVRWPEHVPAGTVVGEAVELSDVAPTVLAFTEVEAPPAWTGVSLSSPIEGGPAARSLARSAAFATDGEAEWRVSAVHNRRDSWIEFEDPSRPGLFTGRTDTLPEFVDDEGSRLLRDLMAERSRDVLAGWDAASVRRPDLPPDTLRWLETQDARLAP